MRPWLIRVVGVAAVVQGLLMLGGGLSIILTYSDSVRLSGLDQATVSIWMIVSAGLLIGGPGLMALRDWGRIAVLSSAAISMVLLIVTSAVNALRKATVTAFADGTVLAVMLAWQAGLIWLTCRRQDPREERGQ